MGCEIRGCDRLAKSTLISTSDAKWQVCRPCEQALSLGLRDEGRLGISTGIPKPEWLAELTDKQLRPPSVRERK